jgi:hypothetical protein
MDGLWFLSLDVTNRANTVLGRLLAVPYHVSDMSVEVGDTIRYVGHRRGGADAPGYEAVIQPETEAVQGPLDVFLTGRWSAYLKWARLLVRCDVEHEPWPLRRATSVLLHDTMLASVGVPVTGPPALVHFASGVSARLSRPTPVW